ncbi:MAG: hypothetical protein QXW83_01790 [Nitrososphaerales archaeon]
MDYLSLAIGFAIGAACGSIIIYIFKYQGKIGEKMDLPKLMEAKSIESVKLDKMRRELKTLLLEKDLLSNALTRVYEAESEGVITKEEREKLSEKYREQLKLINEKLSNLEVFIEVGELEKLREELFNLFKQKIEQIDERLQHARSRLEEISGVVKTKTPMEAIAPTEKKVEKQAAREELEVDVRVKKLRDEVLEALAKLEQIDIEE